MKYIFEKGDRVIVNDLEWEPGPAGRIRTIREAGVSSRRDKRGPDGSALMETCYWLDGLTNNFFADQLDPAPLRICIVVDELKRIIEVASEQQPIQYIVQDLAQEKPATEYHDGNSFVDREGFEAFVRTVHTTFLKTEPLPNPGPLVLVVVEGGLVQDVLATGPIRYQIKDWDNIKDGEAVVFDDPDDFTPVTVYTPEKFMDEVNADMEKYATCCDECGAWIPDDPKHPTQASMLNHWHKEHCSLYAPENA